MNVNHFSLEEFDKALFVPDYIAKLENVIEIKNSSKKLLFNKARSKIAEKSEKIWTKIFDFLDTANKNDFVKGSLPPVDSNYQKTLDELKDEEIKIENKEEKKVSVADLLNKN